MASEVAEEDTATKRGHFMCGVCEGFYGKPWTTEQRKELFHRMERFGMNTYLYAPKDDYKHRLYWRDLYTENEAADLQDLIEAAKERSIKFVYAISPGLDITYSSHEEVQILTDKLGQVRSLGCESFAILFDDIEPELCPEDEKAFESMAEAQCAVTNKVFNTLEQPQVFLFCPTEYCNSRAVPELLKSEYLNTLGNKLQPGISILWTGTRVVTRLFKVDDIKEVKGILKRPPVIWENLHANDYDQTRLYLGPYDGRPPELVEHLSGVLTNPNCEFEMNFVAMHTLAQWSKNRVQNFPQLPSDGSAYQDVEMQDVAEITEYAPKLALVAALEDWLPEFYRVPGTNNTKLPQHYQSKSKDGKSQEKDAGGEGDSEENTANDNTMDTGKDGNGSSESSPQKDNAAESSNNQTKNSPASSSNSEAKSCSRKKTIDEMEPLEVADLLMLSDLFSLPFDHGPRAVHVLKQAHWLITNVDKIKDADKLPRTELKPQAREWYEKAMHFHDCYRNLAILADKVINIPNRDLLYDLYNYISDMRSVVGLVNSYIKWHGMGKPDKEPFRSGEQEPWLHRAGLHGEFRRLLPLEGKNDLFPRPENMTCGNKVFTVRPYFPCDKDAVYEVCSKTWDDGFDSADILSDFPDLLADEMVGGFLQHCPEYCYVLQDEAAICGFAVATLDIKDYQQQIKEGWYPKMREKYPSPEGKGDDSAAVEVIGTFHQNPRTVPLELYSKYPSFLHLNVLRSRVEGIATPTQLLECVCKVLKVKGSNGVHTLIRASHIGTLAFYLRLGFTDITDEENTPDELLILAKPI